MSNQDSVAYTYWSFISYRHADNEQQDRNWATWLHQEIERYEIPAELVGTKTGQGDVIPESIYPVFRDEVSLPADAALDTQIKEALDQSAYLIVLCSPRAVKSRYVNEEIQYFIEIGRQDRIITAIIAGEQGDPARECFPEALKLGGGDDWEPLAADFRLRNGNEGYTSLEAYRSHLLKGEKWTLKEIEKEAENYGSRLQLMKLKLIAGILDLPLEKLRNRDRLYKMELARKRDRLRSKLVIAFSLLFLLVSLGGMFSYLGYKNSKRLKLESEIRKSQTLGLVAQRKNQSHNYIEGAAFSLAGLPADKGERINSPEPSCVAALYHAVSKSSLASSFRNVLHSRIVDDSLIFVRSSPNNPKEIEVVDAGTDKVLSTLSHTLPVVSEAHLGARLSPNGRILFLSSTEGQIGDSELWELLPGKAEKRGQTRKESDSVGLGQFSPNSLYLRRFLIDKSKSAAPAKAKQAVVTFLPDGNDWGQWEPVKPYMFPMFLGQSPLVAWSNVTIPLEIRHPKRGNPWQPEIDDLPGNYPKTVESSRDGKHLLVLDHSGRQCRYLNVEDQSSNSVKIPSGTIKFLSISKNGKRFIVQYSDSYPPMIFEISASGEDAIAVPLPSAISRDIEEAAFLDDEGVLILAKANNSLSVVDLSNSRIDRLFGSSLTDSIPRSPTRRESKFSVSRNSAFLIMDPIDSTTRLWDLRSGTLVRSVGQYENIVQAKFFAGEQYIALIDEHEKKFDVHRFLHSGEPQPPAFAQEQTNWHFQLPISPNPSRIEFFHDQLFIQVGPQLLVRSVSSPEISATPSSLSSDQFAINRREEQLVVVKNGTATLWNLEATMDESKALSLPIQPTRAWSLENGVVVAQKTDRKQEEVNVWSFAKLDRNGEVIATLQAPCSGIDQLTIDPWGRLIGMPVHNEVVYLNWDGVTQNALKRDPGRTSARQSHFSYHGSRLLHIEATAGNPLRPVLYSHRTEDQMASNLERFPLDLPISDSRQGVFSYPKYRLSPDGKTLAYGVDIEGRVRIRLWRDEDPNSKETLELKHDHEGISDLGFSPDGKWLYSIDNPKGRSPSVFLWNLEWGLDFFVAQYHTDSSSGKTTAAFDESSDYLAVARKGMISVYRLLPVDSLALGELARKVFPNHQLQLSEDQIRKFLDN